jgi:hypothetical protein
MLSVMALGEKLFEESGNVLGFKVTKVHPVEGTTMEVSLASELKGFDKFPSGRNVGSGIMTQYPHGVVDASNQGTVMTAEGTQFIWGAHGKSKLADGGKIKGIIIVSGFTNSEKLSWLNRLLLILDQNLILLLNSLGQQPRMDIIIIIIVLQYYRKERPKTKE